MSSYKLNIMARLDGSEASDLVELARSFLEEDDTRPVSERAVRIMVSEALRLWGTRQAFAETNHHSIIGAARLVERLHSLDPNTVLEQYGFMNPRRGGVLLFCDNGGEFVGIAIGDNPAEPRRVYETAMGSLFQSP